MIRTVNAHMSRNLVVTGWTDSLNDAYALMREKGVRHLPVVDDEDNIVGLISDRDFMRALQVEQPDFASGHMPKAEFDPNSVVRDFMSWPVEAVDSNRTVGDAARRMIDKKISALMVTRNEDVVGIVTTEDLLRVLINETETLAEKVRDDVEGMVVDSPVGQIAQTLANVGI